MRDLRYFCLAAELEHVSRAAEKLGVSQPFLTKTITQLEDEIGIQLFDNVGRHIKLNRYGEFLYERAKKIISDVERLVEEMDNFLEKQDMTINLISDTTGYTPDIVLAYKKLFPDNLLTVSYGLRDEIIEALKTGAADFALCTPPLTEEKKIIETEIVFREYGCIAFPPGHPLIDRGTVGLEDLADEPIVISPRGAGVRNNMDLIFEKYGYAPKIACESNDINLLLKAVMGGLGFAFMPRRLMYDSEWKPYCSKVDIEGAFIEIGISYNKNSVFERSKEEFLKFLRDFFTSIKL